MEKNKLEKSRELCKKVNELAKEYNLEFFFVTEGASSCNVKNNDAVKNARKNHKKWEIENGFDPKHTW